MATEHRLVQVLGIVLAVGAGGCLQQAIMTREAPVTDRLEALESVAVFQPREEFFGSGKFSVVPGRPWLALRSKTFDGAHSILSIWDYERHIETFSYQPSEKAFFGIAPVVSPDQKLLAFPLEGAHVGLVEIPSGKPYFKNLVGHVDCAVWTAFHPDGRRAVTAGEDGNVVIWDLRAPEGEDVIAQYDGHDQPGGAIPTCCVALSPDGRLALTGDADGYAILWEVDTQKTLHRFRRLVSEFYEPTKKKGESLGFVLTGPNLQPVEIFQQADDRGDEIVAAAFFADGSKVAIAGREMGVHVFDTRSGQKLAKHVAKFGWLRDEGPLPSNKLPVSLLGQLKVTDGRPWVNGVAVSPDGKYILIASDPYPKLWEWQSDRLWLLKGHHRMNPNRRYYIERGLPVPPTEPGGVMSVAFSHDGRFAITGGDDGTVRLWDVGVIRLKRG